MAEQTGLLDFLNSPGGMGLLSAVGAGLAGARRGGTLNAIGSGLLGGVQGYAQGQGLQQQQQFNQQRQKLFDSQVAENEAQVKARQLAAERQQTRDTFLNNAFTQQPIMQPSKDQAAMNAGNPYANTDFLLNTAKANNLPGLDQVPMGVKPVNRFDAIRANFSPAEAMDLESLTAPKKPNVQTFKPGETVRNMDTGEIVFQAPDKPAEAPSAVREYQFAKGQGFNGTFQDWVMSQKRAGASNVTVRNDIKTGESLAGQIGPMVKDSYTAAQGAVQTADAANRVIQAVDSGKLVAGPLSGARLNVLQIADSLGVAGKDGQEKIANTRQAIRGLSEMTLQGRKQMTGQGAITESEGKLAERAMSGDITMTPGELRQLANASRRAAKFMYDQHQGQLGNMRSRPDLAGMAGFYNVAPFPVEQAPVKLPGVDADIDPLVQKYLGK